MRVDEIHFVVPGPLEQLTGGYIYDGRMVAGMRALGRCVRVHNLEGRFPDGDARGRAALESALAGMPDGARAVIDGLAMGGLPEVVEAHAERLRIVSLVHHPLADETGLAAAEQERFRVTERRALAACRGVIVSSAYTARNLATFDVPSDRVRVVEPGTERAQPAAGPGEGEPPVLLCVASLTPRKGHDVLFEALGRVRDLEWTCVCAGSPDRDAAHARALTRQVEAAGLDARVRFIGERTGAGLEALYHGASAYVLASHHEGYGMALAEALARGLPVVSTTAGAIPFTVPASAGLLVDPGDPDAFAEGLRTLLTDAATRVRLAHGARAHAEALPTWSQAAEAFALAVEELTR